MGVPLDNQPLWEFTPEAWQPGIPDSCQNDTFDDVKNQYNGQGVVQQAAMEAALEKCFSDYQAGGYTQPVFTARTHPFGKTVPIDLYDIQLSPRFSWVPQFLETVPPTGSSGNLNITAFRAIFMQDVYAGCNGNGCNVDYAPGPWNSGSLGSANDTAGAMSAWVFPPSMLPAPLQGNPAAVGQNTYIQLIR